MLVITIISLYFNEGPIGFWKTSRTDGSKSEKTSRRNSGRGRLYANWWGSLYDWISSWWWNHKFLTTGCHPHSHLPPSYCWLSLPRSTDLLFVGRLGFDVGCLLLLHHNHHPWLCGLPEGYVRQVPDDSHRGLLHSGSSFDCHDYVPHSGETQW